MADPGNNGESTANDGRFKAGNPGRRHGSKNKRPAWADAVTDDDMREILKKMAALAKEGDTTAARILLDRLWPMPKGRTLKLDLPDTSSAAGVEAAMSEVTAALAAGDLEPTEAQQVASVLETQRRTIETSDLAAKVAALEEKAANGNPD